MLFRSTAPVYRDPSGWYHVVLSVDTTQATASNRMSLYVNGTQVTSFGTDNRSSITQNGTLGANLANPAFIGSTATSYLFDGYQAEINMIDGQALTPSSFGQTDSATGVWVPKKYSGTYGANGFYLPLTDTSSTTNLVKDNAPIDATHTAANNWTPNNISLTAGTTYDSMIDVPYCTGQTGGTQPSGNYCVGNPLDLTNGSTTSTAAFSDGNLSITSANSNRVALGTLGISSGKWYWECSFAGTMTGGVCGIAKSTATRNSYVGIDSNGWAILLGYSCAKITNDSGGGFGTSYIGTSAASGDIIGCALDMDSGKVWWRVSSVSSNAWGGAAGGDPVAGTGEAFSTLSGTIFPAFDGDSRGTMSINFGQRPFSYTPPSGFKALCSPNLTSTSITTSGSFTGNAASDGPFIYLNGNPTAMTINGNSVTFGTNADKLANGFKVRTSSASYNAAEIGRAHV